MKYVKCVFQSSDSEYTFLCADDTVAEGEHWVADTSRGVQVVRVVSVFDGSELNSAARRVASKYIFDRVDLAKLEAILSRERRLAEIEEELTTKLKALEFEKRFEALAQVDSGAKALLAELRALKLGVNPKEIV